MGTDVMTLVLHCHRRIAAFYMMTLTCVLMWGCSSASSDQCSVTEDCFNQEICVDGTCQLVDDADDDTEDDTNQDADDNSNRDSDDDPDDLVNQNQNDPLDCIEHVGICGDRYCHPELRRCVDCVRNDHCGEALECDDESWSCECPSGTHDCHGQCVADDDPAHCGQRCDPCPDEAGAEPICVDGECALECEPGFETCSGPGCEFHCLECEADTDCTDPERSRCYEGRCQGCATSDDCAHNEDRPVCDRDSGTCIQCNVEEPGYCGGNSCNPATNECTDTTVQSLGVCERCVADSECRDTQRCVPMYFAGQPLPDGYCMYREDVTDCLSPHHIYIERISLSGVPTARYCGIREEKVSCDALDSYFDPCEEDEDCGADGYGDGICMSIETGTTNVRCSHACTESEDCPPGAWCLGGYCMEQ